MADDVSTLFSNAVRSLMQETMLRAPAGEGAFILNPNEPGFVETMKSVSSAVASKKPGAGRKPICAHANHVLYGWELTRRAVDGDMQAFANADWEEAWKLEQVDDAQWAALVEKLEGTARHLVDAAPRIQVWNQIMLTGVTAIAAHTAYHLGAVRQILRDVT